MPSAMTTELLEQALETLGAVLADRATPIDIAVVGGGALMLLGLIRRSTVDLDVVGIVDDGRIGNARPLPPPLRVAVEDVARSLDLAVDWMNGEFSRQLQLGLPEGFLSRTVARRYGDLTVRFASRIDQIFFKLYADADRAPGGKHHVDLVALAPTADELNSAARWVRAQEADPSVIDIRLRQIFESLGVAWGVDA
jgi:hypothetical protein